MPLISHGKKHSIVCSLFEVECVFKLEKAILIVGSESCTMVGLRFFCVISTKSGISMLCLPMLSAGKIA